MSADRFIVVPAVLSFTLANPSTGQIMVTRDGSQVFTWREMIMNVLLQDERAAKELNHFERAEIAAVARAKPGEVVRLEGKLHAAFEKLLLDSPAFDAVITAPDGRASRLHGFYAQQEETLEWIHAFVGAATKDPRVDTTNGAHASA